MFLSLIHSFTCRVKRILSINNKNNFMSNKMFWSIVAPYITEFIAFKRSLGYKYEEQERILSNFDKFVLEQDQTCIGLSKQIADKWAERRNDESELSRYGRMVCLCQFSEYLRNRGIKSYLP